MVHRLVAALVAGGLVISAGLGVLELRHAQAALQLETAQRTVLTVRHLQSLLRHFRDADADDPGPQVKRLLSIFTDGRPVRASRVRFPGSNRVWSWGPWPEADADYTAMHLWPFPEHAMSAGDEVSLDRLTLVQAPFNLGGRVCLVELLVDGPSARQRMRNAVFDHLATQWLLLALMTLLGLLLLRRWVLGPLLDVVALLGQSAQPEAYRRLARRQRGEFRRLAHSIADTLDRLEATSRQLAQRERAFQSLYQLAPSAMISLDPAGRVVEANRRAAALLGAASPSELIGRRCIELIRPEDRPRLQEAIDRLLSRDDPVRCQLRLDAPGHAVIHAAVEAAAVRDEEGAIQSVRLTLLDISRDHQHQRQLEDQSRLLSLMLDHLNDAVLLVDPQGRIAAFNRKLIGLVHCSPESLRGTPYRPEEFWEELGVRDPDLFAHRLRHMEAESQRPCQERFQTRRGAFVIHSIPVPQGDAEQTARLWVVQEAAPQEPSEHLSQQRRRRLQVLKRIGQSLNQTRDEEQVLQLAAGQVRDLLGVDAAGVAIRRHGRHSRSRQLIDQGPHACHLRTGQLLVRAIEESLLPLVLHQQDVAFWPDVPSSTRWGKAMAMAGYTCLAAGPLQGLHETWGMVWIACRAGRRLDPAQLQLLEALMPLLSARMQVAAL
ncbi:MAG TPA: PAS domain-containing protein, partial [Phycisphaeraceae bacterium]